MEFHPSTGFIDSKLRKLDFSEFSLDSMGLCLTSTGFRWTFIRGFYWVTAGSAATTIERLRLRPTTASIRRPSSRCCASVECRLRSSRDGFFAFRLEKGKQNSAGTGTARLYLTESFRVIFSQRISVENKNLSKHIAGTFVLVPVLSFSKTLSFEILFKLFKRHCFKRYFKKWQNFSWVFGLEPYFVQNIVNLNTFKNTVFLLGKM